MPYDDYGNLDFNHTIYEGQLATLKYSGGHVCFEQSQHGATCRPEYGEIRNMVDELHSLADELLDWYAAVENRRTMNRESNPAEEVYRDEANALAGGM